MKNNEMAQAMLERAEQEVSFYGDEIAGIPAEKLYTQSNAQVKLTETETVLSTCKMLLNGEKAQ